MYQLAKSAVFALSTAMIPFAASAESHSFLSPSKPVQVATPRIENVDTHNIILMDISTSMDAGDLHAAFSGVAQYLESDEVRVEFEMGICQAVTPIFYADFPKIGSTHIICSSGDAERFLNEAVLLDITDIRIYTGNSTPEDSLTKALYTAQQAFLCEEACLNISAARRNLVVLTDDKGVLDGVLNEARSLMGQGFGVRTSAVILDSHWQRNPNTDEYEASDPDTLREYFEANFIFSAPMLKEHGIYNISPGISAAAKTPAEVELKLKEALSLTMG